MGTKVESIRCLRSSQYARFDSSKKDGPHALMHPPADDRVVLNALSEDFAQLEYLLGKDHSERVSRVELYMGGPSQMGAVVYADSTESSADMYIRSARLDVPCSGRQLTELLFAALGVTEEMQGGLISLAEQSHHYTFLLSREEVVDVESTSVVWVHPGTCIGDWIDVSPPRMPFG